ncbi:CHASE2 domain-containing protein [Desulfomarina sp.]
MFKTLLLNSLLLFFVLSAGYLFSPEIIRSINLKTTDIILSNVPAKSALSEVIVVDIDEKSLKKYGQWPWPRYRMAFLLEKIAADGAGSIGIDILFPEKDRTSPVTWRKTLEEDFGFSIDISGLPEKFLDNDVLLAKVLTNGPFVAGYEFLFKHANGSEYDCNLQPVSLVRKKSANGPKTYLHLLEAKGVICNCIPLNMTTSLSGFLNGAPDFDGFFRRLPLLIRYNSRLYPSFTLAMLMQFTGEKVITVEKSSTGIVTLFLGNLRIPTDNLGNFLFGPPVSDGQTNIPATDILEGHFAPDLFKDKIVIVGSTASGLTQYYPTAFRPDMSLLDLHKYSLESILAKTPTIRTPLFSLYEVATAIFLCLILLAGVVTLSTFFSTVLFLLCLFSSWIAAIVVYKTSGYLFSPFFPTILLTINFSQLHLLRFRHFQIRARAETRETFSLLQDREKTLRSILTTIPDIIFRLDSSNRITFISHAVTAYGMSPKAVIGQSIFDFIAPEDREKAKKRLTERAKTDQPMKEMELCLLVQLENSPAEENKRYFNISAEGIYEGDTPVYIGLQGIARDVTIRKKLEGQLLQAQKMEVIGNLAAGIAHDLNNILSGLVSYPDLLLLEVPKDGSLYKKITIIQKSGQKAAAIVQDLLVLARRSVSADTVCNINTIIEEYLNSPEFGHIVSSYPKIDIIRQLEGNLMNIRGSDVQFSKVIMNMVINAAEAIADSGRITISTANVHLRKALNGYETIPPDQYVSVSVSDSGTGIHPDDLDKLFEPFFTKKRMGRSGTGLGMTIIWTTVKDHNGFIDIQSTQGEGTTLTLYFPATDQVIPSGKKELILEDHTGTGTLLVVDDIEDQLEIATNMLSRLGYHVHTASSGKEALEIIKKEEIDLVILDMIMPSGLDGLETYREIIRIHPGQKAIITSGFSESERVRELQQLGAGKYLAKPYTLEQLCIAISEALDEEKKKDT